MPTRDTAAGDLQDASRPRDVFPRLVAWLVVLVYIVGTGTNFWLQNRLHALGTNFLDEVTLLVGFGGFAVVGALLVARRPANLIGWILAAVGLMVGVFPLGDTYAAYVMITSGHPNALAVLGAWIQSWYWYLLLALALCFLPLLFPDGRLPSRRWLPLALVVGMGTLALVTLAALTDTLTGQYFDYKIENPIGIEGLAPVEDLPVFGLFGIVLFGLGCVGGAAAVVVKFRRARGIERQQMKWFVYAVAPVVTIPVLDHLPDLLNSLIFGLVIIALPTAIGIAVLRYRLYEIDLLINRTLVYGALTASLVLIYLGGVVSLQFVFRALTGGESQVALVASTLAIAALFNPLRHRIQSFIDRRFYRRKYDAARTLKDFSSRLRDETNLEELSGHLVGVVRETVQPAHVSLWMRPLENRGGASA